MTLNGYLMSNSDFVPAVLFFWRSAPLSSFPLFSHASSFLPLLFSFSSGPLPYIPLEVDSDGSRLQQRESFPSIPSLPFPFPFTPVHPIPSIPLSYLPSPLFSFSFHSPLLPVFPLPLEVGPLNPGRSGGAVSFPAGSGAEP